jgi:hypothetical protein
MDLPDHSSQPLAPQLPRRRRPAAPTDLARGRHTEDPAATLDLSPARPEQQSPGTSLLGATRPRRTTRAPFLVIPSSISSSSIRRQALGELDALQTRQARPLSPIDPLLRSPPVTRGLAHPDLSGHDTDRAPSPDKLYHSPAELQRTGPRHHRSPFPEGPILTNQLQQNGSRSLPSGTALVEGSKAASGGLPAVTRTVTVPALRASSAGATAGDATSSTRMRAPVGSVLVSRGTSPRPREAPPRSEGRSR